MLHCLSLTKSFENPAGRQQILNQLDLRLNSGELTVLLGSNGVGKSTLVKLIIGELYPDSGDLLLEDTSILSLAPHKRVEHLCVVNQNIDQNTCSSLTVLEHYALRKAKRLSLFGFPLPLKTIAAKALRLEAANYFSQLGMGLEACLDQYASQLSGGQRQCLSLMLALLHPPKLLLLDEHTAALDPKTAKQVMTITQSLVRKLGVTTLMITHSLDDALTYGDRIILLKSGRIAVDLDAEKKQAFKKEDLFTLYQY